MRRFLSPAVQRGMTMIELMVALGIMSALALTAAPFFSDYGVNARLRESGNTLYAEALLAQSEAIKRNRPVELAVSSNAVTVTDIGNPAAPEVIRTRALSPAVAASAATLSFVSQGWTQNFTSASIDLSYANTTCSNTYRCPGLRIDGGGSIRLCRNHVAGCS